MEKLKKAAAIHDISGFGKCSLTVALPIISAAGIEAAAMPTAVLSTHTGGIEGFTYRDLTEDMIPFMEHWKSLNLEFDAIYSGYLGSSNQISIVSDFFDSFKSEDNVIMVDPVMADNGKLYPLFDQAIVKGMASLCAKADIIVPNLTEAVFMLEEEYIEGPYSKEYVERILRALTDLGAKKAVLTGVWFKENELGAAAYDSETGQVSYYFRDLIPGYYHGTGDVFGSVLISAVLNDFDLAESAQIAVDFVVECIERTKLRKSDVRFGVDFESGLFDLIKRLKRID